MDLPPLLLQAFLTLTERWRMVFTQRRLLRRAQHQALGALLVLGRATLSRILWTNGREQCSWSADYFLHARAKWDPQQLFAPLRKEALRYCPGRLIGVAVDDTRVRKTGRTIVQAAYHRDPLSPPFHTNLILALRFLQASLLLPLHRGWGSSPPAPSRSALRKSPPSRSPASALTLRPASNTAKTSNALTSPSASSTPWPLFAPRSIKPGQSSRSWLLPATAPFVIAPCYAAFRSAPNSLPAPVKMPVCAYWRQR
jgi:hypothetical protein